MENKHTTYDLKQMQSLPLEAKIRMSQRRIEEWYDHYDGNVYVSFSGGKDSTVLLHLVRELYPNVPAVFVDTGLEYPEIKDFVKTFDNVTVLRPKMSFRQVIEKHGYPVISKDVADAVHGARAGSAVRKARLNGTLTMRDGSFSRYNCPKYKYLLDAPFQIGAACCDVMKKRPLHNYNRKTGSAPIVGMLACESMKRKNAWIKTGCNAFKSKDPQSNPISFWTEQDILRYIKDNALPIASVYDEIVEEDGKLRTTGADRTGCVFCMFGAHLEKSPNRFERLKETHPQLWEYCMKPWKQGGLGLKEVCDFCGIKTGENKEENND